MKFKTLTIMVAVVLLAPALAFGMASFDYPVVAPVVSFVQGDVTVKGAGAAGWESAEVGRLLASGDTVKTGPASKAEISCATGKMRLYENTVIVVPEVVDEGDKKDVRRVDLDDGTSLFRIKKRGAERGFEVHTSNIIAGVKGTLFAVLHDSVRNFSRVAVYSGNVEVTDVSRSPDSATDLSKGMALGVQDTTGFGDVDSFEPGDVWDQWERVPNPDPQMLTAPPGRVGAASLALDPTGTEGEDDAGCPPVVDNDGNVVVQ